MRAEKCSASSLVTAVSATSFVSVTADTTVSLLPPRHVYVCDSLPSGMVWQQRHRLGDVFMSGYSEHVAVVRCCRYAH
jgi:hypothetical protein